MKDAILRQQKDRLLEPLARELLASVSPNLISFAAVIPGIGAAMAIAQGQLGWGLWLWFINRLLDGLDGVVARVHHKKSDLGGYLDLLLDFVVYLAVPIAFVVAAPSVRHFWALGFLLAVYQMNTLSWTLLSSVLEKRNRADRGRLTSIEMPTGLIEGAETVIFYTLFFLLPQDIFWLYLIMGTLVLVTAGQRVWWAWRNLR